MPVLVRLLVGVPLAAVIAIALFLTMRMLIAMGDPDIQEARDPFRPDIHVKVVEHEPTKRQPIKKVEPVAPPPGVTIKTPKSGQPIEGDYLFPTVLPNADPVVPTTAVVYTPPPAVIDVRIPAVYPTRALEMGVEGNCVIGFDIGPDGTPLNVEALSCTSSVFRRASIQAVQRWRYSPDAGGQAARTGAQAVIEYELTD